MFGTQFYPTPEKEVEAMCKEWFDSKEWGEQLYILDPSAGAGNILKWFSKNNVSGGINWKGSAWPNLFAIEIDKDLQHVLTENDFKVIGSDFLKYNGDTLFDAIIMNPPFANGDEHFLKAWDILQEGYLCCLLNAETLKNPHTRTRQLVAKIIADANGTVEYIQGAFKDAERPTGVEIARIKINKVPPKSNFDFEFKNVTTEKGINLDENTVRTDEVATMDIVSNMIRNYDAAKSEYIDFIKARKGVFHYIGSLENQYGKGVDDWIGCKMESGSMKEQYNRFCAKVREAMWTRVIKQLNIERYMTAEVQRNFNAFTKAQGAMEFTKENVWELVKMLLDNGNTILDRAIVEVFDTFTKYHDENRCHVEGWKTNNSWKVNQKIILPHWVNYNNLNWNSHELKKHGAGFRLNYNTNYNDIDKVMCYITGQPYETCGFLSSALEFRFDKIGDVRPGDTFINEGESQFFYFKFWKKGTLHITFKDKWLWQEFNMRACDGKAWLPPAEKKAWTESKKEKKADENPKQKQLSLGPITL